MKMICLIRVRKAHHRELYRKRDELKNVHELNWVIEESLLFLEIFNSIGSFK